MNTYCIKFYPTYQSLIHAWLHELLTEQPTSIIADEKESEGSGDEREIKD